MGSIGANKTTATPTFKTTADLAERYAFKVGTTTSEIEEQFRKDFNVPSATSMQITALRKFFSELPKHEYMYDGNKTPFNVEELEIERLVQYTPEELQRNKELFGRTNEDKTLVMSLRTRPSYPEGSVLNFWDTTFRHIFIGKNGGMTYYDKNNKLKHTDPRKLAYSGIDFRG